MLAHIYDMTFHSTWLFSLATREVRSVFFCEHKVVNKYIQSEHWIVLINMLIHTAFQGLQPCDLRLLRYLCVRRRRACLQLDKMPLHHCTDAHQNASIGLNNSVDNMPHHREVNQQQKTATKSMMHAVSCSADCRLLLCHLASTACNVIM